MRSTSKQRLKALTAILFLSAVAYAKVTGPEPSYTGAPGDIGNCVFCHDTFHEVNVGPGSVRVNDLPEVYSPGQQYTISVTTQQGGRTTFGFQMTAIDSLGNRAGTLASLDNSAQVSSETWVGGRQYIEHTEVGTGAAIAGSRTWQIRWTAPSTDTGTVRLFVAGNAANGDSTNQGDYIYLNSAISDSASSHVTAAFGSQPGGLTLEPGSVFTIGWSTTGQSNIDNQELRYSTDDGATFPILNQQILFTTDPSITSYQWTIPNTPTTQARLRLRIGKKSGDAVELVTGAFTIAGSGGGAPLPRITGAARDAKRLYITGENFQQGAKVEMNGEDQKTNNEEDFSHMLRCKKAGKKIDPGETVTLAVRNPDGSRSGPFLYTRPL